MSKIPYSELQESSKEWLTEEEYDTNLYMQGGVAWSQFISSKFKDTRWETNPYPNGSGEARQWETGYDDAAYI